MTIQEGIRKSGITPAVSRKSWSRREIEALFDMPFNDLVHRAQTVHRANFDPNEVQMSTLLSIKTGACPEDCKYCPQSIRYNTPVESSLTRSSAAICHQQWRRGHR